MDIKTIDDYMLMVLSDEERKWNPDSELAPHNCKTTEEFVVKNLVAAEEKIAQLEEELEKQKAEHEKSHKLLKTLWKVDRNKVQRLKERVSYLEQQIRLLGGKIGSEGEVFCERRKD